MSLRTNPVEGISALERSEMKYVPYIRPCDDPHKAFARNRVTKSPDVVEQTPAKDSDKDGKQDV